MTEFEMIKKICERVSDKSAITGSYYLKNNAVGNHVIVLNSNSYNDCLELTFDKDDKLISWD